MEGRGRGLIWGTILAFFPEGTEENHEKPIGIAGLGAEIWTRYGPNTKQECEPLDLDVR
jgi:hypothetical protein